MNNSEEQKNLEKVAILIDANNFYNNLKSLKFHNLLDFNYEKFAKFLSKEREIITKRYYKGVIRKELDNPKSQQMVSDQQRLFAKLKEGDWEIEEGSMLKYPEYKKCEGIYLIEREIRNEDDLKEIGKKILSNYKTCYNPIIILTPNFPRFKKFKQKNKENLKPSQGIYVISNKWREKGVDVKIAIDMVMLAYRGSCDSIILVSNDSDLLPAVKAVKDIGKEVEYIGFEKTYSISLLGASDRKKLLTEEELKNFLPPTLI